MSRTIPFSCFEHFCIGLNCSHSHHCRRKAESLAALDPCFFPEKALIGKRVSERSVIKSVSHVSRIIGVSLIRRFPGMSFSVARIT
jgi:hypothetical protein